MAWPGPHWPSDCLVFGDRRRGSPLLLTSRHSRIRSGKKPGGGGPRMGGTRMGRGSAAADSMWQPPAGSPPVGGVPVQARWVPREFLPHVISCPGQAPHPQQGAPQPRSQEPSCSLAQGAHSCPYPHKEIHTQCLGKPRAETGLAFSFTPHPHWSFLFLPDIGWPPMPYKGGGAGIHPEDWTTSYRSSNMGDKGDQGSSPATSKWGLSEHRLWSGDPKLDGLYLRPSATAPVSDTARAKRSVGSWKLLSSHAMTQREAFPMS